MNIMVRMLPMENLNKPSPFIRIDEIESLLNEMDFEVTRRPYVCFPRGKFTPIILLEARKLK